MSTEDDLAPPKPRRGSGSSSAGKRSPSRRRASASASATAGGTRSRVPAADDDASAADDDDDASAAPAVTDLHAAYRTLLTKFQTLGLTPPQVVFELHCRQGRPLTEVAQILALDHASVCRHWQQIQADIAARAPTTPEQFAALREDLAARLWATVEDTHQRAEVLQDGQPTLVDVPPTAPVLSVRLKALDQLAKLYGANLERGTGAEGVKPYEPPAEIARRVSTLLLELHGRGKLLAPLAAEAGTGAVAVE